MPLTASSFLIYDIESSGLHTAFDQVIQFAAIRTDLDLRQQATHNILVRLSPDTAPSAQATLTHCIAPIPHPQAISELKAIQHIHALLNQPGTISCGYNTLGFDDELLRFSFYRHLLTPYTHQYAHGCRRFDLYPTLIFYLLYQPDSLNWPEHNGTISLKLEQLAHCNSWSSEGRAHQAMHDVIMTLELARCLKRHRHIWDYVIGYFDKSTDQHRLRQLPKCKITQRPWGLYTTPRLGPHQGYQCPCLLIGAHKHYTNQTLWLRLDKPELRNITNDTIDHIPQLIYKKYGEPGFVVPPAPRFLKLIDTQRMATVNDNLSWLAQQPLLLTKIERHHCHTTYPYLPHVDVDAALYQQGFPSRHDQQLAQQFHQSANPSEQVTWIEHFQSPALQEQAIRILGRYNIEQLPEPYQKRFQRYLHSLTSTNTANIPCDQREQPRRTPHDTLNEINHLKETTSTWSQEHITLLNQLEHYAQQQLKTRISE